MYDAGSAEAIAGVARKRGRLSVAETRNQRWHTPKGSDLTVRSKK
jgi:hypothetical protein